MSDDTISASKISPKLVRGYRGFYNRVVKRAIDFVLALFFIIILAPLLVVISVFIVIDDGFPILYKADRGGYKGKTFQITKFRTMVKNADQIGGGTTALNDKRITRVGAFLRKTKLDEFANLFSILNGNMSFVGPRPELVQYTNQYKGTEKLIFQVRPGITDYSSIEFINLDEMVGNENADEMYEKYILPKKNKLRVKYAATVSFTTDCQLFFCTVWKVLEKVLHIIRK